MILRTPSCISKTFRNRKEAIRDRLLVYVKRQQAHSSLWQRHWWDWDSRDCSKHHYHFCVPYNHLSKVCYKFCNTSYCMYVANSQRILLPASSWRCLWLNSDDASPTPCKEERKTEKSQQWVKDLSMKRLWHGMSYHVNLTWKVKHPVHQNGRRNWASRPSYAIFSQHNCNYNVTDQTKCSGIKK